MKKLHFIETQIVQILGQAETSEMTVTEVCHLNAISENTFYRWRKRYGDMPTRARSSLAMVRRLVSKMSAKCAARALLFGSRLSSG